MNNKPNNIKILILILALLIPCNFICAGSKTKILKPKNAASKITIIISGKHRIYYSLSIIEPIIVTTKGPGKLRIITRGQFDPQGKTTMDYSVYYRVNGGQKIKADFDNVKRDSKAKFKETTLGYPGTGEDIIMELGRGEHTIELWCGTENSKINVRFLFTEIKAKRIDWVSLSPLYPNEPVDLVTNETVYCYYRFSEKKPLKIKITGPTTFRVLSRVENHYQMKGRINYRLQVKEDKAVKNTYLLSSFRSEVTVYRRGCGKTPGKAREIVITVPKGTHIYEIIPLDKDKETILARILFPKKDVKIKE